jgi:putative ABC transport system permease protein
MLQDFWQDLRYAVRLQRRAPLNSAIAIAILALGIGANTAMFSAINHVLLRPLPFPDADRLLRLRDQVTGADGQAHAFNMSSRSVLAVREDTTTFAGVVAMSGEDATLTGGDVPERVSVVLQSDGFDETLHVTPVLGRAFTPDEARRGLDSGVALVSYAVWQARFGGAATAIGTPVRLDDRSVTIIGVMPPGYAFPYEAQFWLPFALDPADRRHDFAVWARPRAGLTATQVRGSLDAASQRVRQRYASTLPSYGIEMMTLRENLVGTQDAPLRALTQIVSVLLLVACVNLATMMLVRAVARQREFALRAVLGASRARHIRQLATESLLLATIGCGAGLVLTGWLAPFTARLVPSVLSGQLGLTTPRTDWRVAMFAVAVSLVTALVAGIVPAVVSWRRDPKLSEDGRTSSGGPASRRMLGGLIVAETALTVVLLAGAGLVIKNYARLQAEPLGFAANGLLALELAPSPITYASAAARATLADRIVDAVRVLPGVSHAALTTVNPLGGGTWGASVITERDAALGPEAAVHVNDRLITPALFDTMRIPLQRGRAFTSDDRAATLPVAVVSAAMARRLWPGHDAIGQRLRPARPGEPWVTVVGIAGDVSDAHDAGVPRETWYRPYAQQAGTSQAETVYLMVRSGGDPLALVAAARHAIAGIDRTLAPYNPVAMDRYRSESLLRERVSAGFMLGFGAFGLALAALGIYGVVAFGAARRTMEFGIRIALGARLADILALVLRGNLMLVAAGAAAGAVIAIAVNRVLASLLSEVGPLDVPSPLTAVTLILVVATAACLVPALRAARLNPTASLRGQ